MANEEVSPLFSDDLSSKKDDASTSAPSVATASSSQTDTPPTPPTMPPARSVSTTPEASSVITVTDEDIDHLEQSVRGGYADITQKLLSTHKAKDAGDMGAGINQLMMAAKGLNPKEKQGGFLGKFMAKVQGEKEHILANTQSIQKRISELTTNLDQTAHLMKTRITDLDAMKKENLGHQQKLQTGIQQVDTWLKQMEAEMATPLANPQDMGAVNARKSLQHVQQRLQSAIADLKNALILDQQQSQELQSTQDNARAILDEFDRVKNIAIPALTSLVAQQLIALEQQQAMKTDAAVRDMTQQAITQAAQTLGDNQIQIATMQQQTVISADTLTQAQDILDQADQKVKEIQTQGEIKRREDDAKRAELEKRLLSSGS